MYAIIFSCPILELEIFNMLKTNCKSFQKLEVNIHELSLRSFDMFVEIVINDDLGLFAI